MNTARAPQAADSAVVVDHLVKKYRHRDHPAVDDLSFSVRPGEVFGLLGPNGAGKSTTVGIMTTRVAPTSGSVTILGVDVAADPATAHRNFAVVPQRNNLDRSLTIRQNLVFHAGYHGMGRAERKRLADSSLEWVGLTDHGRARVDELSGGQAQRVMIARALMHRPRVLFLDEPATGLDPQSRLFVHERVAELSAAGITVVITTHDMEEAAKLCDRVGIIDHGKLLALDSPRALTGSLQGTGTLTVTLRDSPAADPNDVLRALEKTAGVERVEPVDLPGAERADAPEPGGAATGPGRLRIYTTGRPTAALPAVVGALTELNRELDDVSLGELTLEDVFIELTGRELR
ncbi:ABC transporter ATP-binding protein [Kitasatospora sp. NBC_01250]|uniref:ABC transporter ATP-binding protein n=1 Tax=unclassified Kitasatospora TaxID=2633591 RepID=UPI002E1455B3|nr:MULTISPECIES: ABC transporter ATP-binding protein [unclassified Kitasatospora]WSJ65969.1 ABC transporter ATP-binding protein [Kitasatospora sp. NBC_01302]